MDKIDISLPEFLFFIGILVKSDVKNTRIPIKNSDTGIWSAFLKANTLSLLLSIQEKTKMPGIHPEQKIQIKLEIDTEPPLAHLPIESKLDMVAHLRVVDPPKI